MEQHNEIIDSSAPDSVYKEPQNQESFFHSVKHHSLYRAVTKVLLSTSVVIVLSSCAHAESITPQTNPTPITVFVPYPAVDTAGNEGLQPRPTAEIAPLNLLYSNNEEYLTQEERNEVDKTFQHWREYFANVKTVKERYQTAKNEAAKLQEYFQNTLQVSPTSSEINLSLKNLEKAQLSITFFSSIEEQSRVEVIEEIKMELKSELQTEFKFRYQLKEQNKFNEFDIKYLTETSRNILNSLTEYGVPQEDLYPLGERLAQQVKDEHKLEQERIDNELIKKYGEGNLPEAPQSLHYIYKFVGEQGNGASGILLRDKNNKIVLASIEHALGDFPHKKFEEFNLFVKDYDNKSMLLPRNFAHTSPSADYKKDIIDEVQTITFDQDTESKLEKYAHDGIVKVYTPENVIPELNEILMFRNYDGTSVYGLVDGIDRENGYIFLKAPIGMSCSGASGSGLSSINAPDKIVGILIGSAGETNKIAGRECGRFIVVKGIQYHFS